MRCQETFANPKIGQIQEHRHGRGVNQPVLQLIEKGLQRLGGRLPHGADGHRHHLPIVGRRIDQNSRQCIDRFFVAVSCQRLGCQHLKRVRGCLCVYLTQSLVGAPQCFGGDADGVVLSLAGRLARQTHEATGNPLHQNSEPERIAVE